MCVLRGLHYIHFFLPFGVHFARAWTLACGRSVLLLHSATNPSHACALLFPFFPALSPPPSFCFSLTNFFFFSSHFISSHLKPPLSINQLPRARVPSHNICTFIHTPRRKVTAFVDSHVSFCVIIALPFEPWRAPLLSSRPTPFHHSSHPHTFLRNFHTYKHIHTLTSLLFSPHPPGFTISSKCQTKRQIRSLTARPAAVDTDHV